MLDPKNFVWTRGTWMLRRLVPQAQHRLWSVHHPRLVAVPRAPLFPLLHLGPPVTCGGPDACPVPMSAVCHPWDRQGV